MEERCWGRIVPKVFDGSCDNVDCHVSRYAEATEVEEESVSVKPNSCDEVVVSALNQRKRDLGFDERSLGIGGCGLDAVGAWTCEPKFSGVGEEQSLFRFIDCS